MMENQYPMYQHQQSYYNPYPDYPQYTQPQYPLNQHYQHPHQHQYQQQPQNVGNSQMSLHDIVTSLAMSTQQFQETTRATISNMQAQLGDMATIINKLESRCTIPSQTVTNPQENVNMVSLMSVQEIEESWDAKTRLIGLFLPLTPPPLDSLCSLGPHILTHAL
ncbi:hypothetical protein LXL04_013839 [Taraxacum kok-saghyz]